MQSDVVAIAVSAGIGVSVVAGILSGVCYVLVHGFTKKRGRDSTLQWYCVVCGSYLRNPSEKIKVVICTQCDERVCKKRCSKRDYARRDWVCYTCLKRPSFIQGILSSLRLPYKKYYLKESDEMGKKLRNVELNLKKERECVRDFIEKLVSTIVGGSVDDASIFKMYNDNNYEIFFDKHHPDLSDAITKLSSALQISMKNASLSEQNPSTAHTNLKQLIERILGEATKLPQIRKVLNKPTSTEERTYEELLATAILNKIIDKQENYLASSSEASTSDDKTNKLYFDGDESCDFKWKEIESTSTSSFDDYLYSDSSHVSSKYVDRVSLTIQQRIEEVPSTSDQDDIDGDLSYLEDDSRSSVLDDSNWYLQKRQFHGTNSPVPVPMLVPNPITSAKVLIGDKEIDDTSDLSDANSESDNITPEVENLILIDSSIVFDEKDSKSDFSDEETSFDSGVREDRDDFNEREKCYDEDRGNLINLDDEHVEGASLISNIEQDTEYLEKYSSLPRTYYKDSSFESDDLPVSKLEIDITLENRPPELPTSPPPRLSELELPVFEGSYSKREKEKWNHPVELPYNPYSEENIRKRIKKTDRFGRDYYAKQASLPSGRAKSNEDDFVWPSENNTLFRAEPIATTDSDVETQEYTQTISDTNSELSLIHSYNVEDGKIYNEPYINQPQFKVITNDKEPNLPETEDIIQPEIIDHQANFVDRIHYEIQVNKKEAYPPEIDNIVKPNDIEMVFRVQDSPQWQAKVNKKEPFVSESKPISEPTTFVKPKLSSLTKTSKFEVKVNKKDAFEPEADIIIKPKEKDNGGLKLKIYKQPSLVDSVVFTKPKTLEKQSNFEESPELKTASNYEVTENYSNEVTVIKMDSKPQVDRLKSPFNKSLDDDVDKPRHFPSRTRITSQSSEEMKEKDRTPPSPNIVGKKSDNTWIKKIYANPIVRNFALTNREQIPSVLEEQIAKPKVNETKIVHNALPLSPGDNAKDKSTFSPKLTPQNSLEIKDSNNNEQVSINHNFSLEFSDTASVNERNSIKSENDFNELKGKRLVACRLGEISKSFPNLTLTKTEIRKPNEQTIWNDNENQPTRENSQEHSYTYEHSISVKNLRKLFEKDDGRNFKKDKPVHSLTARSISKEMKLKLASYNNSRSENSSREEDDSQV